MLTNKQIKLINSLHSKKGRILNQLFLVEGEKSILELLNSNLTIQFLVINDLHQFDDQYTKFSSIVAFEPESQIEKLSTLVSNNFGIAVVNMPKLSNEIDLNSYTVILDGIRDPGNLGTIIRVCDWYGINQIVLSNDCTDFYNPKVISATMGSFLRIKHFYADLDTWLSDFPNVTKIGALLNGSNIHQFVFPSSGFIVFGNESNGISGSLIKHIDKHVTIPGFGGAESLNVGISCAVFLDNLRRS
jgi:TrmH family RNA methyltransferase